MTKSIRMKVYLKSWREPVEDEMNMILGHGSSIHNHLSNTQTGNEEENWWTFDG